MTDKLLAKNLIRDVADFPKPGIIFKDITPILQNPEAFAEVVERLSAFARNLGADAVVGIESRGFIFGAPVAVALGLPFVPIRKEGKLPHTTMRQEYALEYGEAVVEIHADACSAGQRVVIIDDLLATAGTARAAAELIGQIGCEVAGFAFLIELGFLGGRERLFGHNVEALITY